MRWLDQDKYVLQLCGSLLMTSMERWVCMYFAKILYYQYRCVLHYECGLSPHFTTLVMDKSPHNWRTSHVTDMDNYIISCFLHKMSCKFGCCILANISLHLLCYSVVLEFDLRIHFQILCLMHVHMSLSWWKYVTDNCPIECRDLSVNSDVTFPRQIWYGDTKIRLLWEKKIVMI